MDLDFSEFHPLDHSFWECHDYPGGRRRHLQYRWEYQWSETLTVWWKHVTLRHEWRAYAYKDRFTGEWNYAARCLGCDAEPDADTAARLIATAKKNPPPDFLLGESP